MDWYKELLDDVGAWWHEVCVGIVDAVASAHNQFIAKRIVRDFVANHTNMELASILEGQGFVIHMQGNRLIAKKGNVEIQVVEENG